MFIFILWYGCFACMCICVPHVPRGQHPLLPLNSLISSCRWSNPFQVSVCLHITHQFLRTARSSPLLLEKQNKVPNTAMSVHKGCQISWNCSYRKLWTVMWVLGTGPRSSGRATSVLNCLTLQPPYHFLKIQHFCCPLNTELWPVNWGETEYNIFKTPVHTTSNPSATSSVLVISEALVLAL